jgi:hypothetical protein
MYITPFMTARMSVRRLPPPRLAGGINRSTCAHSSSVRSLGPQRAIRTGGGPVEVRRAKVRDRADVAAEEKIRFTSSILPKWARRTKSLDAL